MPKQADNYYVLTGGPGSGKTTLLKHLGARGMNIMPESGRAIIKAQMAIDGSALPWADRGLYAELMLSWDLRTYEAAEKLCGTVLFDRGLPDILGYLALEELEVPAHMVRAAQNYRYNATVFIAPPWKDIFNQDAERRQDFEIAERTFDAMRQIYTRLEYKIIELPFASIERRAEFVCAHIREKLPR